MKISSVLAYLRILLLYGVRKNIDFVLIEPYIGLLKEKYEHEYFRETTLTQLLAIPHDASLRVNRKCRIDCGYCHVLNYSMCFMKNSP